MTESSHPEPHPVRPLAPSASRALAGVMIHTATPDTGLLTATILTDVIDAASWAVLAVAGLTPIEARAVLAALWAEPAAAGSEHWF